MAVPEVHILPSLPVVFIEGDACADVRASVRIAVAGGGAHGEGKHQTVRRIVDIAEIENDIFVLISSAI